MFQQKPPSEQNGEAVDGNNLIDGGAANAAINDFEESKRPDAMQVEGAADREEEAQAG